MSAQIGMPACDLDAEGAVLSACILSTQRFDEVRQVLRPEDFYADRNRRIYESIVELDAKGQAIDITSIAALLREKNRLQQVGGSPYLAQIADATPAVAHVVDHARIVASKARIRAVTEFCQSKAAEGRGGIEDVGAWLQGFEAGAYELTRPTGTENTVGTMPGLVHSEFEAMTRRAQAGSPFVGIPTGIRALDRRLNGLKRKLKYVLAARPGIGKTGLALTIARNVARTGWGVVFVSLEMPKEQLTQRAIAQEAKLNTARIERGALSEEEWRAASTAARDLRRLPIAIDDAGGQTVASIRSSVRRQVAALEQEFEHLHLGLIVIDFLQLITPIDRKGRSREDDVREISKGTTELAKEFNVPVLELSQLNREVEKRPTKRPTVADLRESGAIEQDAFGIVLLYRDDYYRKPEEPPDNTCEYIVGKCRQGGSVGTSKGYFHAPSTYFGDLHRTDDEEDAA